MKAYGVYLYLISIIIGCTPVDPDFRVKPLRNSDYTGFISREFFQVVVEVDLQEMDGSIEKLREECQKESLVKRDKLALPILREVASANPKNRRLYASDGKNHEADQFLASFERKTSTWKKPVSDLGITAETVYRGDFVWLLDQMFLHKEDYSKPGKCKFVYRNISKNLYEKVENTVLSIPTKEITKPVVLPTKETPNNQGPANQVPGAPIIPTTGTIR